LVFFNKEQRRLAISALTKAAVRSSLCHGLNQERHHSNIIRMQARILFTGVILLRRLCNVRFGRGMPQMRQGNVQQMGAVGGLVPRLRYTLYR
jgi:hypothetical protein